MSPKPSPATSRARHGAAGAGACADPPRASCVGAACLVLAIPFLALFLTAGGCKGSGEDTSDAATDGDAGDGAPPVVACADPDGGVPSDDAGSFSDEFGPNAPGAKAASALGRVNVYEITTPRLLERVDIYLRADLPQTRVTLAVQEATSKDTAFKKLLDVQIDMDVCQGWASSGPLSIPLQVGRYYAIGFDPNQPVTAFVSSDADSVPIDGAFGRLIGAKTATSVSVTALTWDKFSDKDYNRQRLVTSPRADDTPDAGTDADTSADAASTDGGAADATGG